MTYTKEQAKQRIKELVERFRYNLDVYKKSSYNEAQVRIEFINPFFVALGWDVSNKQGFAEQYKEVIYEDVIKVGRSTRAPDYSFRIGGQRKFFVEAKKPAVNIKEDVSPAYQLRRYAWSAKLPLSVVTDFEEFSVFDCRIKPNPNDKSSVGRIAYYTFEEYLDKFDEIYTMSFPKMRFSKEALIRTIIDSYNQLARKFNLPTLKVYALALERFIELLKEGKVVMYGLEVIEKGKKNHYIRFVRYGEEEGKAFVEVLDTNDRGEVTRKVYLKDLVTIDGKIVVVAYEKYLDEGIFTEEQVLSEEKIESIEGEVEGTSGESGSNMPGSDGNDVIGVKGVPVVAGTLDGGQGRKVKIKYLTPLVEFQGMTPIAFLGAFSSVEAITSISIVVLIAGIVIGGYLAWKKIKIRRLIKKLGDESSYVRSNAAKALGNIGHAAKEAVPALIKALGDGDWRVRRDAAKALGNIDIAAKEAVPALIKVLLGDKHSYVREDAAWALENSGVLTIELKVKRYVVELGDKNSDVRRAAANALGKIGPAAEEAVPALIKALGDEDWRVRENAANALGNISHAAKEAVPALIKALEDEDWRVRSNAASALGKIGHAAKEAVPALIKALGDKYSDVRENAEQALKNLGVLTTELKVKRYIVELGDEGSDYVRSNAAKSLGNIGPAAKEAVPALIKALGDKYSHVCENAEQALKNLGVLTTELKVKTYVANLGDEDWRVREYAAKALGKIGPAAKEAIPALIKVLGDDFVRRIVADALEKIGPAAKEAVPALIRALGDEDYDVRGYAEQALENFGVLTTELKVKRYIVELGDEYCTVRRAAARALEKIGPAAKEAVPALITALGDKDSDVRADAAWALENLGVLTTELKVKRYIIDLGDEDYDVRSAVLYILGTIYPAAKEAVPVLIKALGDKNSYVRGNAAYVLGRIDPAAKEAIPALIKTLGDKNSNVRADAARALGNIGPAAKEAVPALIKVLGDEDGVARSVAADALGNIGLAAELAAPALIKALGDEFFFVRNAATDALENIGPAAEVAVPALIKALGYKVSDSRADAARALGNIGPAAEEAVLALIKALGDEDYDEHVRRAAAWALGKIGPAAKEAVPALIKVLGDEDGVARSTAAYALGNIGLAAELAAPALVKALGDEDSDVRRAAAEALENTTKDPRTLLVKKMRQLLKR